MIRAVSAQQMRECDARCVQEGTPVSELMERAAAALAEELLCRYGKVSFAFFCGGGNNGGDGLACARILIKQGCPVEVYAEENLLKGEAGAMRDKLLADGGTIRPFNAFCGTAPCVLVDCLYGTGLNRPLGEKDAALVRRLNEHPGHRVACDIPSGLHADSGTVLGEAFRAELTVTFQACKYGQLFGDGVDLCGELVVKDIGIPLPPDAAEITDREIVKGCFPQRRRNSHKGTYGKVTLVAGSDRYFGAALIAENACASLRTGCGYATLAVPGSLLPIYQQRVSVSTLLPLADHDGRLTYDPDQVEQLLSSDVIAFGMGLGCSEEVGRWVLALLERYGGTLLLDADGLNSLAQYAGVDALRRAACRVCLTPHVKEFSRLTGLSVPELLCAPWNHARAFAAEYGVNLLLKGTTTVITDGDRLLLNTTGSPALAKAGSGDVLSGIAGALLARVPPLQALAAAAWLHGTAGIRCAENLGEYSVLATDLCAVIRDISEEKI